MIHLCRYLLLDVKPGNPGRQMSSSANTGSYKKAALPGNGESLLGIKRLGSPLLLKPVPCLPPTHYPVPHLRLDDSLTSQVYLSPPCLRFSIALP